MIDTGAGMGHKEVGGEYQNICSDHFLRRNDDVLGYFLFLDERLAHESHGHLMYFCTQKKKNQKEEGNPKIFHTILGMDWYIFCSHHQK